MSQSSDGSMVDDDEDQIFTGRRGNQDFYANRQATSQSNQELWKTGRQAANAENQYIEDSDGD